MAKKKPARIFVYLGARTIAGLFFIIPRKWALAAARGLGRLAYVSLKRHSNPTFRNLTRVFGREKSEKEIHEMGARVFENLLQTGVEVLQFPKLTAEKIRKMVDFGEARETYRDLLKEGRGLISITAHLGNWELLAGIFAMEGFEGAVVARRIYYEPYNRWIVGLRAALKLRTIYRERASREILTVLKHNQIVGMLPDQDIASLQGVFVDFFGRPAYTTVAPVRLSLATGAPVVVNFLIRENGGRYRVVLADVLRPKVETTKEAALKKYTELWMKRFEDVIRQVPDQWGWMHDRWKTQPQPVPLSQGVMAS